MRTLLTTLFLLTNACVYAQSKFNYISFNKVVDLKGTDYVIATEEEWGKMAMKNEYPVFINTLTGQAMQVEFPKGSSVSQVQQVKLDSHNINIVIIEARTVNLNNNKAIDWGDPSQIIVFSTDGQKRTQITDDSFFARTWAVNDQTATIVITGHYDTNNNGKYDKTDKNEILIYNLKQMKLISRI